MRKILNILIVLFISLASLELGAGGILHLRKAKNDSLEFIHGEYLRGRFIPNQSNKTYRGNHVNINAFGLRGPELETNPNKRVIVTGDSVIFGWDASSDQTTYPAKLDALLPDKVEVINAAMPRWNTLDLLDLYITRLSTLQPQIFILHSSWNDIGYHFTKARPPLNSLQRFKQNLALTKLIETSPLFVEYFLKKKVLQDRQQAHDKIQWDYFEEWENTIRAFVTLTRENKTEIALVTLPHYLDPNMSDKEKEKMLPQLLSWTELSYTGWEKMVREINQRLRKLSQELQIPLADCENQIPFESFTDICHLSDEGHQQLAQCVRDQLGDLLT